ncbi:MAG: DUF1329 domain-containing protein [Deltaproteobacteria bacterium]|nr:DUF1329 domain-containing protein [Deltaproteobacteria bacterium]
MNWRRRTLLGTVLLCALAGSVRADEPADQLQPGDVLNQSNWHKAKDLLPPEILKHYQTGEYINPIVEWPADYFVWPPDFLEGCKRNEGRYDTGPNGEIIEKATGKQPPFIFGHPFPTIDPKDPAAGAKIIWNFMYRSWYFGNMRAVSQVLWVSPRGVERRSDNDVNWQIFDGVPESERLDNPQGFTYRNLILAQTPADLNGLAALSWRYKDAAKRDQTWTYVPALRRVRAVSPSNRSDGFLGSDMAQDDGPFFDGKIEDFTWNLIGEADQLRLVDPLNLKGQHESIWLEKGGWRTNWPDELKFLGFMDPSWKGVGWAPATAALAKRRHWIVESVPKDKYYLFGKLQLYIDKVTFQGAWNRKFGWQGELLNSFQVMSYLPLPDKRPDGKVDYNQGSNMAFVCVESIKRNQATLAGIKTTPKGGFDLRIVHDRDLFEVNSLGHLGK